MKNQQKDEEMAASKYQLIAPLLEDGLDPAKERELRMKISESCGLSERSLRRYVANYHKNGFMGLRPAPRKGQASSDAINKAVEHAILLRREVPGRSVSQIIQILEWEGVVEVGALKRSTLQERLSEKGYSSRQMKMYRQTSTATRRFQRRHRNQLWHSDIKYGPYLPIGPAGTKKQVYLVVFIDDATRFVVHASFYALQDSHSIEDAFRQAIQKHGVPESVYFDNGKQYRTKWMNRTCSKMGTRLLYAKPYSPESTGKVERFNRTIDSFLSEVSLEKPNRLDKLNELLEVWLSECYQHKAHTSLGENVSPMSAFRSDQKALRFISSEELIDAFLHCEARKVDKSGCISFLDKKYEVGISFVGCKVDVLYDPADVSELTIEYQEYSPWKATELVIGEQTGKRPELPETLQKLPVDKSRLLRAAEKQRESRQEIQPPAVSYRNVNKGVNTDV
ncbi:transposase [Sporosarcina sp. E16_8]|nr:transposase [Sporosarcina sp. E16_8]